MAEDGGLARDARAVFAAGVEAVRPERLLTSEKLVEAYGPGGAIRVLAVGKASRGMASVALGHLGSRLMEGLVVYPEGGREASPPESSEGSGPFREIAGGHPVPSEGSVRAGEAALALARRAGEAGTPLLVLLSGGGSALLERPAGGLSLADLAETTRLLLGAGVPIGALNAVRKHLSAVKGGRLALAAEPAPVITLALSDVVGDGLETVGSGPAVPDPSTFADALGVLAAARLRGRVSPGVEAFLEAGARGEHAETPGALAHARAALLGSNREALIAAAARARALGYRPRVLTRALQGEAREVGAALAAELAEAPEGACLLWGGETTVTLRGDGRGGRSQELALAAALALEAAGGPGGGGGLGRTLLAAGTDGVDGPTDAAGAVVDGRTAQALRRLGLDPDQALAQNDSHGMFSLAEGRLGPGLGLVRTGPTGTNVMDLGVGLVGTGDRGLGAGG